MLRSAATDLLRPCALLLLLLPVFLLAPVSASSATAPAAAIVTADMSLADYARHISGKQFFGGYALGGKRGWIADERRVKQYQGDPILEVVTEMYLEISMFGVSSKSTGRGVKRYALEGEGQIIYVQETEIDDDVRVEHTGVREGDRLRIVTRAGDKVSERLVPLPRDTLKVMLERAAWLAAGPRKGDKYDIFETSLFEENIDSPLGMEYIEPVSLVWAGVPVAAHRVTMNVDGMRVSALVGPTGEPLSGRGTGGLFEFRAEEELAAKARDAKPGDMLAASQIKVEAPVDAAAIAGITLELTGLGDLKVPATARQRVRSQRQGRAQLEIVREVQPTQEAVLTAQQREQYLGATATVQSDQEAIRKLATDIVGNQTDAATIAALITEWIGANLRRTHAANASTALDVLAQLAGDGTEHALLFTTLARAAGVPARQIGGVVQAGEVAPLFGWHTWAEFHDGRGWVGVDPLFGQVRLDPTHVQLTILDDESGKDAWAWLRAASGLKIKVKAVDSGG
ncbi:MAG TPA: transglutaminase-like domain-containing protein [Steroidobacteraceae bacterium]|nr:transglutaminase-like domain-containing protein [Steroidobacteraceae bacterium]